MTSVTGTSSLQGVAAAAGTEAASRISADFGMFLKMLTTQMQNQDPLDPMDTSEYTQQLVQYSQVEQSIQQTDTLKDILASLATQSMAQVSGFIGREGTFDSAVAGLTAASPATWNYRTSRPVQSLSATISDPSGKVVDVRELDPDGPGRFAWDGTLANGAKAAPGAYTLTVAGLDAEGAKVPVAVTSIGLVREVLSRDGAVTLGVNGAELPATSLIRVSDPEAG